MTPNKYTNRLPNLPDDEKEMTTPTPLQNIAKLLVLQAVTTSTPTHPASGGWSMFTDGQGSDSPLSEIENADSPAQSTVTDVNEVYVSPLSLICCLIVFIFLNYFSHARLYFYDTIL